MPRLVTTGFALLLLLAAPGAYAQSITDVSPSSPYPGHSVSISGSGLSGATDVRYDGTSVAFTVVSDTEIQARVPAGATADASFTVTTSDGSASSSTVSLDTDPGLYGPRRALSFDGSGDYVKTGANGTDLGLANESFSIGVWFKLSSSGDDRTLVGMDGSTTNEILHLAEEEGQFVFDFFFNGLRGGSVPTGEWVHATFVYDASTGDRFIYKNGEQVASDNTSTDFQGTNEVLIGRRGGGNYFDGQIDQVRVWQEALSAQEVRERASRTVDPSTSGLLASYRFDAGGTQTAFEQTSNYRFGTFEGDPQRQTVSGARLGQESASTTGSDATVGSSGGTLSATNVSAGSGGSIQLYRFGDPSAPRRSNSDPGEVIDGETTDQRSNLTWGLATNGSPSADLEIDYSNVQGVSSPVHLIRRDGPGEPWFNADVWAHDATANTFTIGGTVPEGQYAVKTGPIAKDPPTATTDPLSGIGATNAEFAGTVNPGGLQTTVEFQYREVGASTLQSVTATESPLDAGRADQSVSATVSDLTSGTTYEVKVVATNSEGTTEGGASDVRSGPGLCRQERHRRGGRVPLGRRLHRPAGRYRRSGRKQ